MKRHLSRRHGFTNRRYVGAQPPSSKAPETSTILRASGRMSGPHRQSGCKRGSARRRGTPVAHAHKALYFFTASFAAGAATHAPLPSLPPLASHFIFAFSQSALLVGVGVVCANATGVNANEAITAAIGRNFMLVLL